ncbi:MAG: energy-coupling factor ABC transporter permease [Kiritimatiellales bacterium]|nr:energy-coupling factor ABC transporter permease [Kiritimatiellales bacterium]
MHMADALISPAVGGTMWAVTGGLIAWCAKKIRAVHEDRLIPMMGVLGAFVFTAQMINFTIPATGSSGHLGGGLLLTALLGPYAAFLVMASILTVQALFFADGGLLALGCNIFNLGFFPAFIAYPLIYRIFVNASSSRLRLWSGSVLAAVAGLQLGAFAVVLETTLSGISDLSFSTFVLLMQPIHLAIGVVEGLATAAVVSVVMHARPETLAVQDAERPTMTRRALIWLILIAVLLGGVVSWFASGRLDGLEWSLKKTTGHEDLPAPEEGIHSYLAQWQEKTAFFPDYTFKAEEAESGLQQEDESAWPTVDAGTSFSGLLGGLITLAVAAGIGYSLQARRKNE